MARIPTDDGRVIRLAAQLAPWLARAGGESALASEMDEALYEAGLASRPRARRKGGAVPPGPVFAGHLAVVFTDIPRHMLDAADVELLERAAGAVARRHPPGTVGFVLMDLWEKAAAAWPGGGYPGEPEPFLALRLGLPARALRLALAQHLGVPLDGGAARMAWPTFLWRLRDKGLTAGLRLARAADELQAALDAVPASDLAQGGTASAALGAAKDFLSRTCGSFAKLLRTAEAGGGEGKSKGGNKRKRGQSDG